MIHSRTEVLDIFSTFIQFSDDRFEMWVPDPQLVRSMQQQLAKHTVVENAIEEISRLDEEKFWVLYWHHLWKRESLAVLHLWAYLQESCYWASENVARRFVTEQCTIADSFHLAIADVEQILKYYNPKHGTNLNTYARRAFGNKIRNQFCLLKAANINTDWGLLRRLSQSQFKQSLFVAGLTDVAPSILVWQCFNAICLPDPNRAVRKLPPPSETQLTQIAKRYNHLRHRLSPVPLALTAQTVLVELDRAVKAVRAYLSPAVTSLNQPQNNEAGKEYLESLQGSDDDSPMMQLLAAEAYVAQQRYRQQLSAVLIEAITTLDPPSQKLLMLYYQKQLTQKDIANQLNLKQYQISRRLKQIRQKLLLKIAEWSLEALHISMESTVLASVNEVIHEWLQHHYQPEHLE